MQVQVYLKETWVPRLRDSIRSALALVSKGWFNLEETNHEVYTGSKLKKLMELVKFSMQVSTCRCTNTHIHVLMRDEKEGRKKQARSSKQQGKATQAVTFPKKNELPRVWEMYVYVCWCIRICTGWISITKQVKEGLTICMPTQYATT